MKSVAIVHPWLPQYRREFFELLIQRGRGRGVKIDVYHGAPPPEWRDRSDSIEAPWARTLNTRFIRLGNKHLIYKSVGPVLKNNYDLIIVEQAVRNLETYLLLIASRRPLAYWGHGRTYTKAVGHAQERFKNLLTRTGNWFFAYTPSGAAAVAAGGFPPEHITTVFNSIDTNALTVGIAGVGERQVQEFLQKHDLTEKTALFIGGLDKSKRIDFLLSAGEEAYRLDNDFRLVVAGAGSEESLVKEAALESAWLRYCGPAFDAEKYLMMASAKIIMNPGRVGLVAVDSLAAGLPIVTTDWPWHAPEFDYLESGYNALVLPDDLHEYAEGVIGILQDESQLRELQRNGGVSAMELSVDNMVSNFLNGVLRALDDPSMRRGV